MAPIQLDHCLSELHTILHFCYNSICELVHLFKLLYKLIQRKFTKLSKSLFFLTGLVQHESNMTREIFHTRDCCKIKKKLNAHNAYHIRHKYTSLGITKTENIFYFFLLFFVNLMHFFLIYYLY